MIPALLVAVALGAPGKKQRLEVVRGEETWDFSGAWTDADGERHKVRFSLPTSDTTADRAQITWFPRRRFNEAVLADVRAWGREQRGVKVTARIKGGGVVIGASGPRDRVKEALREGAEVRDQAVADWIAQSDFFFTDRGLLSYDHARLVNDYTDRLRPLADALAEGTEDDRDYLDKALSFVQAIPYEARRRQGRDPGYRRPLALLSRNRGDCDSKTVLFLALVNARMPDLPLSVVYIPGHAMAGLGLEADRDDDTFKAHGERWVIAEPVGPRVVPVGVASKEHRRKAKRGEVHVVPEA